MSRNRKTLYLSQLPTVFIRPLNPRLYCEIYPQLGYRHMISTWQNLLSVLSRVHHVMLLVTIATNHVITCITPLCDMVNCYDSTIRTRDRLPFWRTILEQFSLFNSTIRLNLSIFSINSASVYFQHPRGTFWSKWVAENCIHFTI